MFRIIGRYRPPGCQTRLEPLGYGSTYGVRLLYLPQNIGELAEWSIALVLKTRGLHGSVGSNPTFSAKIESMKREDGFYWVQYKSGNWTVCEWKYDMWHHKGASYRNDAFVKVDERRIERMPI